MQGGYDALPEDSEGQTLLDKGQGEGQREGGAAERGMEARLEEVLRRVGELEAGSEAAGAQLSRAKAELAHLETIAIAPSPAPPALYTSPAPATPPNPPPPFDPYRRPDAPPAVQTLDGRGRDTPRPSDGLPALIRLPESQRPGRVEPSDPLVSSETMKKVCCVILACVLLYLATLRFKLSQAYW